MVIDASRKTAAEHLKRNNVLQPSEIAANIPWNKQNFIALRYIVVKRRCFRNSIDHEMLTTIIVSNRRYDDVPYVLLLLRLQKRWYPEHSFSSGNDWWRTKTTPHYFWQLFDWYNRSFAVVTGDSWELWCLHYWTVCTLPSYNLMHGYTILVWVGSNFIWWVYLYLWWPIKLNWSY